MTIDNLSGVITEGFNVRDITHKAMDAWKDWAPHNTRQPPEGGWDWPQVRSQFPRGPEIFDMAVWNSDETILCGLAIGRLNKTAVVLEALEGNPAPTNPLKGKVLLLFLEAASCYAGLVQREELWLRDPAEGLINLYTTQYGFTLVKPKKEVPYCRRKV